MPMNCCQMAISSIGGIRTLFLLLEQAVSRRVDLQSADFNILSDLDVQFTSSICVYYSVVNVLDFMIIRL